MNIFPQIMERSYLQNWDTGFAVVLFDFDEFLLLFSELLNIINFLFFLFWVVILMLLLLLLISILFLMVLISWVIIGIAFVRPPVSTLVTSRLILLGLTFTWIISSFVILFSVIGSFSLILFGLILACRHFSKF